MIKWTWRLIPMILFLVLGIFLWRGLYLNPHQLPSMQVGKPMPSFDVPQLEREHERLSLKDFHHRVILFNIWASWCESCEKEQAMLMKLASKGVLIYGLNYKDNASDALSWLNQWGNPYQKIGQDPEGQLAIDLGVYGVPETFVIDKKGKIRDRLSGDLTDEVWKNRLHPLIEQLEKEG